VVVWLHGKGVCARHDAQQHGRRAQEQAATQRGAAARQHRCRRQDHAAGVAEAPRTLLNTLLH